MISRTRLRAAMLAAAALMLGGCAGLSTGAGSNPAAGATAPSSPPLAAAGRAEYRLTVQAPDPLRKLLLDHLDLARFQNAPVGAGVDATELERLLRAAPAQARGLLETEGYFNADVTALRQGVEEGLPLLLVTVVPGPQTQVQAVSIDAGGPLQEAVAADDPHAREELAALRRDWSLKPGAPFRQAAWSSAKTQTLARLRADGYAAAAWRTTLAHVDAPANRADLSVVLESGPLYRLGALRIDGASRYDSAAIRNLATFSPGDPYSEKTLLDYQERLQKLGLFGGVTVELDPDPQTAAAAPVRVVVKELQQQQATVGLGYSANTGPRISLEHTDRRFFSQPVIEKDKLTWGPLNQSLQAELSSYPHTDLYRNLLSGSFSKLLVDNQRVIGGNLRLGRSKETPDLDRLYFLEVARDRLDSDALTRQAAATSLNYQWVFRRLDDLLLPTRGWSASAQVAGGDAQGNQSVLREPLTYGRGPFARLYARLTWYRPFAGQWFGTARLEAGQVIAHSAVGVPDALLFRAGGDDSVRGYGYRSLGPAIQGVTVSGRNLLTGSLEVAHPISPAYPAFLWALFADAGDAADRWQDLRPAVGYGAGLRWRSPVGPVKVDLAYGQRVRAFRVHLSVGVTF